MSVVVVQRWHTLSKRSAKARYQAPAMSAASTASATADGGAGVAFPVKSGVSAPLESRTRTARGRLELPRVRVRAGPARCAATPDRVARAAHLAGAPRARTRPRGRSRRHTRSTTARRPHARRACARARAGRLPARRPPRRRTGVARRARGRPKSALGRCGGVAQEHLRTCGSPDSSGKAADAGSVRVADPARAAPRSGGRRRPRSDPCRTRRPRVLPPPQQGDGHQARAAAGVDAR